jgi:hypothetical protein
LLALARAGSLFVLHLVSEGKTIEDPDRRLSQILASYRHPVTYDRVHRNLRRAASVLDVDVSAFLRNPKGFVRVALYLLRTMLYVRCATMGMPMFSMGRVAQRMRQSWIAEVFGRRGCTTFDFFVQIRSRLLQELDIDGHNEFETLEALAAALYEQCPIAACLALKLLAGSDIIDYDSTFLDWSHNV